MDGNYSSAMQRILYMLEDEDFEIADLLKLQYEVNFHVATYFEYLNIDQTRKVLAGQTAKQLNKGPEEKDKLLRRKERFAKADPPAAAVYPHVSGPPKSKPKSNWHGTIYVSGLSCEEKDVADLLERYSHVRRIKFIYCKAKKIRGEWTGDVIALIEDLEAKQNLIKKGLYLPEHKEYKSVKVEHHQKINWPEEDE